MASPDLFHLTRAGDVHVVELSLPIDLDVGEFDRLNDALLSAIGGAPDGRWVLDLSRLDYMGSASLGLMVNVRQQIKQAGGRLVLCGMSPRLIQIFRTCCMEQLFKIARTRDEAIEVAER